ncbi:MAG: hypothetical protein JWO62_2039 [Acidimicrobiaceae bacterium]|nr:hypothetical protein [Acidimicrobiaceae bacterium]
MSPATGSHFVGFPLEEPIRRCRADDKMLQLVEVG